MIKVLCYNLYMDAACDAAEPENEMFAVNEIVRGKVAGVFVVLGFRVIAGEQLVQVKPVNPNNLAQAGAGEMALSADALRKYDAAQFYAYDADGDQMEDDCAELGGFYGCLTLDAALDKARSIWPDTKNIRVTLN